MTIIANRYELKTEIGAGAFGSVFKGLDNQTGQPIAIKRLKPEIADKEIIERFRREGEALRELNHPNIVKMLDTIEEKQQHYLIMEYVSGGDLHAVLENAERLSIERVLNIALDLADALTRAHRLNIIHRDLKPANVLIANDGTPRLTDFGVAHFAAAQSVTEAGVAVGTMGYLAPEVLGGSAVDERADIWAFGVILFEMLTRNRPFTGDIAAQIVMATLTEPVPDLEELRSDCPIALADLIYRMLEKDPNARIRSIRIVGAELEAILKGYNFEDSAIAVSTPQPASGRFDTPFSYQRAKHNLPVQTTPFIGRERELVELAKLLDNPDTRLVTILAPGGMGKTRLSLASAAQYLDSETFADGVYFVDLAPLSPSDDAQQVEAWLVPAIASAMDYQLQGDDQKSQLLQFLQHRKILLIIDNFEHLISGAGLVMEIVTTAPDVQVIATSRIRLNQPAEMLFYLSGMDFPKWETPQDALEYAAVRLFQNSAKKAQATFEITGNNLDYIARICRLVQGMPLGIVLAASWVAALSLQEIADEIQSGFDILETDGNTVPDRQHSVRVVFDYTWRTMAADEQDIFMKMSVFHGGFTRQAAQGVTGATLRQLMALVTKSMIYRDANTGRYTIHELLRQYAAEKLDQSGDANTVLDAHMRYYAASLHKRENEIKGALRIPICNDIDGDLENVLAAWERATRQSNLEILNQMVDVYYEYALNRHYHENRKPLEEAAQNVTANEANLAAYGRLLARASEMQFVPQYVLTEDRLQQAEKALNIARTTGNRSEEAFVLRSIGAYYNEKGQYEHCIELLTEAETIAVESGDTHVLLVILFKRGYVEAVAGRDIEKANVYWQKSLAIARERNDIQAKAWNLNNLGVSEIMQGNLDGYEAIVLELLNLMKQAGMTRGIPHEFQHLGNIAIHKRDFGLANQYFDEAVTLWKDVMPDPIMPLLIASANKMNIELEQGHYEAARQHELDALRYWQQRHDQKNDYIQSDFTANQSLIACGLSEYDKAQSHLLHTFSDGLKRNGIFVLMDGLVAYQCILSYQGDYSRSVEIASLVWHHPACTDNIKQRPLQKTWRENVLQHLSQDEFDVAWEQGKSLDFYATVEAILKEMGDVAS